jgi:hypothetical protein
MSGRIECSKHTRHSVFIVFRVRETDDPTGYFRNRRRARVLVVLAYGTMATVYGELTIWGLCPIA